MTLSKTSIEVSKSNNHYRKKEKLLRSIRNACLSIESNEVLGKVLRELIYKNDLNNKRHEKG